MTALLEDLIQFAEDVGGSIPVSNAAPNVVSEWMRDARHFTNECMIEHRLKPELESLIPLRERGRLLDALTFIDVVGRQYQGQGDEVKKHFAAVVEQLGKAAQLRIPRAWLREDPTRLDATTSLSPKEVFARDLASAIAQSGENQPLALLFVDVDSFKTVNDTHGHPVGDAVLATVASHIRKVADGKGKAYRYAGDEFVLLVPNTSDAEAIATAERLRVAVEALTVGPQVKVTVSIGVAVCTDVTVAPESLLKQADDRLYESKAEGRNRVVGGTATEHIRPVEVEVGAASGAASNVIYPDNRPPSLSFGRFPEGSFSISDANGEHRLELPQAEHLFLWIAPSPSNRYLSSKAARKAIQESRLQPMGAELLGSVSERNVVGAFICRHENYEITQLTQLHNNGELFGIDFESISKVRLMKNAGVRFGILPTLRFERIFTSTLANYLAAANILRLPLPLSVTAGVTGIRGFRLAVSPEVFGNPYIGKALHHTIVDSLQVSAYDKASTSILRPYFDRVWEEFGEDRPDVEQLDQHA